MLSTVHRWRNVLKDLSFVDASCADERRKIVNEIYALGKAPMQGTLIFWQKLFD